jgi:hypothetical protein
VDSDHNILRHDVKICLPMYQHDLPVTSSASNYAQFARTFSLPPLQFNGITTDSSVFFFFLGSFFAFLLPFSTFTPLFFLFFPFLN